jgi:phosphopantothenoylcysteine decarboxylase/phosphopantothenate--cysteine ligase
MNLHNKKIIVGITGGIAAYKTPALIRLLKKDKAEVRSIMTSAATRFITVLTIETVCQHPVAVEMFPEGKYAATHHIDWALWADLIIVAPATADFIAKVAAGICNDMLSAVICVTRAPVLFAPSMNSNMYLNPITQKNITFLKSLGYTFIDPEVGDLACETYGPGRMAEPDTIFKSIRGFFQKKKLLINKKVIVTAGPCRESLDPVRFISNRSTGKMGYAIADAAARAGAEVVLISGPTLLEDHPPAKIISVETTQQMYNAVKSEFGQCDYLIMAAAPADFRAKRIAKQKIKKNKKSLFVELSPTIDILNSLKKIKTVGQKIVGFALETEEGLKNAKAKLKEKDLDLIVLNSLEDVRPFEGDVNIVTIIDREGNTERLPSMTKKELAWLLIERISRIN